MLVIDYGGMQNDTHLVPVGRLDFFEALTAVILCEIHLHNQLIIAKRVLKNRNCLYCVEIRRTCSLNSLICEMKLSKKSS